jgi:hypothetical protein
MLHFSSRLDSAVLTSVPTDLAVCRNEWWVPGKIVEVRKRLAGVWRAPGGSRDVLLLDIALDNYFRCGQQILGMRLR